VPEKIRFTVNGDVVEMAVEHHQRLLDVLREDLALTGAKEGCGGGECGACTVLMDNEPVNACLVLAVEADGREIITIEGLARENCLDPLQEAFIEHAALQCGFCTPGMILSAKALLLRNPNPTEAEVKEALSGNLCRCTGYKSIVDAVLAAAEKQS